MVKNVTIEFFFWKMKSFITMPDVHYYSYGEMHHGMIVTF